MLIAAFKSRSIDRPQSSQLNVRSLRGSLAFTAPQFEHVLLDGNHLSTTHNTAPERGAVIALCEWYALHAVDSNYELYCDDNEMRAGTKASMIEWLHGMWSEFA